MLKIQEAIQHDGLFLQLKLRGDKIVFSSYLRRERVPENYIKRRRSYNNIKQLAGDKIPLEEVHATY